MNKEIIKLALALSVLCASAVSAVPAAGPSNNAAKEKTLQTFLGNRFGMFLTWGIYSVPAGVWNGKELHTDSCFIKNWAHLSDADYRAQVAAKFNPAGFSAKKIVSLAREAGMKNFAITAKHVDGFCMWDTKYTDFDIMDATPFKRDIIRELAGECGRQGVMFGLYFPISDWDFPNGTRASNKQTQAEFNEKYFRAFIVPQVLELVKNYNPRFLIFDCDWHVHWNIELARELESDIRKVSPNILINDRLFLRGKGEGDYKEHESFIPGVAPGRPWQTWTTTNRSWGYVSFNKSYLSNRHILWELVDCSSRSGNYMINFGPRADGTLDPRNMEQIEGITAWMKVNGGSIEGSQGTLFDRQPWGRCTAKPGRLYLHIFYWPEDGKIVLRGLKNRVTKTYFLADPQRKPASIRRENSGDTVIAFGPNRLDPIDTVLVLEHTGKLDVANSSVRQAADGSVTLEAATGEYHGMLAFEPIRRLIMGRWDRLAMIHNEENSSLLWRFSVATPGTFTVQIDCLPEMAAVKEGAEYIIEAGDQRIEARMDKDLPGNAKLRPGKITLAQPGNYTLVIRRKNLNKPNLFALSAVRLALVKQ